MMIIRISACPSRTLGRAGTPCVLPVNIFGMLHIHALRQRGISAVTNGYGYNDYGATCYVDIDPNGLIGGLGSTPATPYRNKNSRVNGLLKQGKTRIA